MKLYMVSQNKNTLDRESYLSQKIQLYYRYYKKMLNNSPLRKKESQKSISLNSDTFIRQVNFQSSEGRNSLDSSERQEKQLTNMQMEYLQKNQNKRQQRKIEHNDKNKKLIDQNKRNLVFNIGNRKNYGLSPSTKDQFSMLQNQFPKNSDYSFSKNMQQQELTPQRPQINRKNFNINSFLNSHPDPIERNGKRILAEHKKVKPFQQTIELKTIPQPFQSQLKKHNKASSNVQNSFQKRFENARLNFIDCFMPQSMKIKNNPYNLLKYIQSQRPLINLK